MEDRTLLCLRELVKCLSGVDILLLSGHQEVTQAVFEKLPPGLFRPQISRALESGLRRIRPGCVYEVRGIFDLRYLIVYDESQDRYLIAGPCLLEKPDLSDLRTQAHAHGIGAESREEILAYCLRLPRLTYDVYHRLGTTLAQWLLPEVSIRHQKLDYQWDDQARKLLFVPDQYSDLAHMRQIEQRYENSAALNEAVKCGNLSLAYRFMQTMSRDADALVRNPDPLRNRKNMCIILNTQLRHALEDGGIHPYLLDRISGKIAIQIESLHSLAEAERYVTGIIAQYCELALDHTYGKLKPFAHLAVTYIKEHLTENITVRDTARALLVNPDYLSDRFHREVGITFIDFVNRERTAQAAGLLSNTSLQIQQIASAVGYNNTSYFSKQFSRFYQMTPRDYRTQGHPQKSS